MSIPSLRLPAASAVLALAGVCAGLSAQELPSPKVLAKDGPAADPAGPPDPNKPTLSVAQIVTLLKVGSPPDQVIRDVRSGSGKYKLTDEQANQLKAAGATPELMDLLTNEKAEPLTEADLIAIAKKGLNDARKAEMVRHRPLGFKLDYDSKLRLITAVPDNSEYARQIGDLITILSRRTLPTQPGRPDEPGRDPESAPSVVVKDWTYELIEGRMALYTFTLENQLPHGIKGVRIRTEYAAKFRSEVRSVFVEESGDLGTLEAFERKRFVRVKLHRSPQPAKFTELRFTAAWQRDDAPPTRFVRHSPRDVEKAVRIGNQVGFLDTAPFPEWHHRFTLVNTGEFAVRDLTLLLRILDEDGRPLWYHEHAVAGTLMPGDIVRERIEGVALDRLWDRKSKDWMLSPQDAKLKLAPAMAEVVMVRGFPVDVDALRVPARTLDVVAPLQAIQTFCSWIGEENPAGTLHYLNFTVVNPHPFAVKDVILLVRFKDSQNRPINYEAFVTAPGVVQGFTARRFQRVTTTRHFGLITESDRAASYDVVIVSATPVSEPAKSGK